MADRCLREKVELLLRDVRSIRPRRNVLIHGQWVLDEEFLSRGRIQCDVSGVKTKRGDGRVEWTSSKVEEIALEDLSELSSQVGELVVRTLRIIQEVTARPSHAAGRGKPTRPTQEGRSAP